MLLVPGNKTENDYLSETDVLVLAWGIGETRKILKAAPLSIDIDSCEVSPGADITIEGDNIKNWIRQNVYIYSHWVGTMRMGGDNMSNADDIDEASIESSAVDANLRVRGTSNVYVADASIMPRIPNGNVHSTVTMIGYRAGDLVAP